MPYDYESDAFFKGLERKSHETSAGPCELPILYPDASLLGIIYRLPPEKATELLAPTPFEPLLVLGKSMVLLCVFEYRETTVGVYNEIGLAIQVKRKGTSPSLIRLAKDIRQQEEQALYIVNLPVTTEGARAAGFELWGYPKYVTGIETNFAEDHTSFSLENEFECKVPRLRGLRLKGMPFVTFSIREDRLLRTVVEADHKVRWGKGKGLELKVTGDGPTAKTIKALELEQHKASFAFRTDQMRTILPAGKDLGPVSVAAKEEPAVPSALGES